MTPETLTGGFASPPTDNARAFRAILDALALPALPGQEGSSLLERTERLLVSQTLPPDFASYGSVRDGLLQLLQFLRLADALILGACLALPSTQRKPA